MRTLPFLDGVRRVERAFNARAWRGCFLLIVLFKLVLVAHSEVETGIFDEVGYANISLHWFGEHDAKMSNFERPPGLPLFAAAARGIGLPYRIAIELLCLVSIGWLSSSFGRLAGSHLIAIIMAGMLALHPWLWVNAVCFMSEPLFLAWSLCWLACLARLLREDRLGIQCFVAVAASGFFLLLMTLTRLEHLVILAFAVCSGVGLILWARFVLEPPFPRHRLWVLLFLPLVTVVSGKQLVCWINDEKCGVAALSCLEAPGLVHLLQSLNEIQAPDPRRYVPITSRSLHLAMEASPSLRLLAEPLARYHTPTQDPAHSFLQGERGWYLMWDLIHGAEEIRGRLPPESSEPKMLNAYWERCAQQLQSALREGRLPRARYAPYPLNPNYELWLRYYPQSWWHELRFLWRLHGTPSEGITTCQGMLRYPWAVDAYYLLNRAAGRRVALLPSTHLEGYAYAKSGAVDGVVLEDAGGARLGSAFALVEDALPPELAQWASPPLHSVVPCRYSIALPFAIPGNSRLVLIKDGRRVGTQPISEAYHIEPASGALRAADGMAEIRSSEIRRAAQGWREHAAGWIMRHYRGMEAAACAITFVLAWAAERPREKQTSRRCLGILLGIMVGCLLIRCSFYALSDACALPNWSRYAQALALWVPVLLFGVSWLVGNGLGERLANRGHSRSNL